VAGDVGVEIDICQRRHSGRVIGAKSDRARSAISRFFFEGLNQRPSGASPAAVTLDDERMQFPNSAVVFRKTADPTDQNIAVNRPSGKSIVDDAAQLIARTSKCRPAIRRIEVFDEKLRGDFHKPLGLASKIDNVQALPRNNRRIPSQANTMIAHQTTTVLKTATRL